jgi:hypothetical protein
MQIELLMLPPVGVQRRQRWRKASLRVPPLPLDWAALRLPGKGSNGRRASSVFWPPAATRPAPVLRQTGAKEREA